MSDFDTPFQDTQAEPAPTTPAVPDQETLRQYALELINQDRADHDLPPVVLGINPAAQMHAEDMLTHGYLGHWWADGRKPYMVYTQTGGESYVSENAAYSGWSDAEWQTENCGSTLIRCAVSSPEESIRDHQWAMMYDDAHADWGHRDNILGESHRAVNIGIAWNSRRVTFVQHFEGGAVKAESPPVLEDGRYLSLSVRKIESGIPIGGVIAVYYDPSPAPIPLSRIEALKSYCVGGGVTEACADYAIRILDPPGAGRYYPDLESNDVVANAWHESADRFSFEADVGRLMEQPGVYTLTLWRDTDGARLSEKLLELSVFVE